MAELSSLRALELRLLHCSLPSSSFSSHQSAPTTSSFSHLHTLIEQVLQFIELGQYTQALSSDGAKTIFTSQQVNHQLNDSSESAEFFYSEFVPRCVTLFLNANGVEDSAPNSIAKLYKAVLVMSVAVAALLGFTQCNITGLVSI